MAAPEVLTMSDENESCPQLRLLALTAVLADLARIQLWAESYDGEWQGATELSDLIGRIQADIDTVVEIVYPVTPAPGRAGGDDNE